jgi:hypothetical protein
MLKAKNLEERLLNKYLTILRLRTLLNLNVATVRGLQRKLEENRRHIRVMLESHERDSLKEPYDLRDL